MTNDKKETNKPVETFRLKGVQASLFTNTSDKGVPYHKVTINRSFKDGDDWKSTSSFSRDDLPLVAEVATRAWIDVLEREANQRSEPESE